MHCMIASQMNAFHIGIPRLLDWAIIAVASVGGFLALALSDWTGEIFVENGLVETAQLVLLFLAAVFFMRASLRFTEWVALTTLALACISAFAFLREIPRCTSPFYQFGPCISDDYKTALYLSVGVLLVVLIAANRSLRPSRFDRAAFQRLRGFIPKLMPLAILVPLAIGSQLGEVIDIGAIEETLELIGYAVLAVFALRAAQAADELHEVSGMPGTRRL